MKKTYIVPAMEETVLCATEMLAASIISIGGDSGLDFGDNDSEDYPTEANSRGRVWGNTPWQD